MNQYFSKDIVNAGRQKELDLAKGMSIIFMIWEHILGKFYIKTWDLSADIIVDFLAGPFAAPVFMFSMGMGIAYSHKHEAEDLLKRGAKLYLVGFILNIFRSLIPELLRALITKTAFQTKIFYSLVNVDILQFAALSFIFLGLMKKWNVPKQLVMALVVLCSLIGSFTYLKIGNPYLANITGLLVPTSGDTMFPFANWIVFPTFGYYFGQAYRYLKDKRGFYKMATPALFGCACVYLGACYSTKSLIFKSPNGYYFMSTITAAFILALVVGWFGVLYLLFDPVENKIMTFFEQLSHNINSVYVLQWTIIGFASALIPIHLVTWMVIVTMLLILAISYVCSMIWYRYKKQRRVAATA